MKLKKLDVCIKIENYDIEAFEMDGGNFAIEVINISDDIIVESHSFEDAWKGLEIMKQMIAKYQVESDYRE